MESEENEADDDADGRCCCRCSVVSLRDSHHHTLSQPCIQTDRHTDANVRCRNRHTLTHARATTGNKTRVRKLLVNFYCLPGGLFCNQTPSFAPHPAVVPAVVAAAAGAAITRREKGMNGRTCAPHVHVWEKGCFPSLFSATNMQRMGASAKDNKRKCGYEDQVQRLFPWRKFTYSRWWKKWV